MANPEWLQSFQNRGFSVRPDVLEPELLAAAQTRLGQVITRELERDHPSSGVARIEHDGNRWITGISETHAVLGPLALHLLGHPAIVETARAICGAGVIPTHDWMVIKNRGDGQKVGWHQDFVHHQPHPAINIGIQFDDVLEDAVRFLPHARGGQQPVERYRATPFNDSSSIPVPVAAGGITIHDVTLVHGSPPLANQARRATLYVEFRHLDALRDHPSISPAYVDLRRQLFAAVQMGHGPRIPEDFGDNEMAILTALKRCPSGIEAANYGKL